MTQMNKKFRREVPSFLKKVNCKLVQISKANFHPLKKRLQM